MTEDDEYADDYSDGEDDKIKVINREVSIIIMVILKKLQLFTLFRENLKTP